MDNGGEELYKIIFADMSDARPLPEGTSLNTFFENYRITLTECSKIIDLVNNGADFKDSSIAGILANEEIQKISRTFPSYFSFKKLSLGYLESCCNTIISSCSVLASIFQAENENFDYLKEMSKISIDALNIYYKATGLKSPLNILEFKMVNIKDKLDYYIKKASNIAEKELKQSKKKLDAIQFKSHVCCACGLFPAVSSLRPCCHSYLCRSCLEAAVNARIPIKCYVCGKEATEVLRLRPTSD